MKEKNFGIFSFFLAVVTVCAISGLIKIDVEYHTISNSVFSIVIFFGAWALFFKISKIKDRRLHVISYILGAMFSFFLVCGRNLLISQTTGLNTWKVWATIIAGAPMMAGCTTLVLYYVSKINEICKSQKLGAKLERISAKKFYFISWIILFLAWLPGLVASYPGVYGYDSVYQTNYYVSGNINLHHPLAHTYLLGFCVENLGDLLGSKEAGFFCYSVFQMICMSGMLSIICYDMAKKKCTAIVRLGVLILLAFLPTNAIMSFSSTKDVLFAGFFCVMTYLFMQMAENQSYLSKKKSWIMILLSIFGLMIFRSQGIYVAIFGLLCGFLLLKGQRKRILVILAGSILLYSVYTGPITQMLNGVEYSSKKTEMMSVPIMQMSRAISSASDQLTEEEKELIREYIPNSEDYEAGHNAGISDSFKWTFDVEKFEENPSEFIELWLQVGLKCPMSYIDAFARLSIGLWYPDMNYRDTEAYHPYWEYENTPQREESWITIERNTPEVLQWLADFYTQISYENTYQEIPVVSMLFSSGFSVWILFLYIAWCIYRKQYYLLFPAAFLVGYWGTMLLGPVVLYRYVYAIMVSIPILITRAMTETTKTVDEIDKEKSFTTGGNKKNG